MIRITFIFLLVLLTQSAFAQSSAKLKQQQTLFYYTQFNLHGGYLIKPGEHKLALPGRGPENQIAFQLLSRNRRKIIRGYTPLISLDSWKARLSLGYKEKENSLGGRQGFAQLKIRDLWMRFSTRWDRTNITIGYRSIPFGHNPKLDPVSSFMSNIVVADLGVAQDMGIFFRTAASPKLDLELSLTSGGMFTRPLMQYGGDLHSDPGSPKPEFSIMDFRYRGTWLLTSRLGQQPFRKNEFGLMAVAGRTPCFFIPNDYLTMIHAGGDWIYKYRELFRMTNQLVAGYNKTTFEGPFADISLQNNIDIFLKGKVIISLSQSLNLNQSITSSTLYFSYLTANSLTYVVSPHTRIRLNQFFTARNYGGEQSLGFNLQFVTGIGKR